jgi:hypothetical protein
MLRLSALFVAGLSGAFVMSANSHTERVEGLTYEARVVVSAQGSIPPFSGDTSQRDDFTVRVTYANGKGRVDAVKGLAWEAGDYVLFDSSQILVVHGGTKTFDEMSTEAFLRRAIPDMSFIVRNTKSTIETIQPRLMLGDQSVSHVRLRQLFLTYFDEDDPDVTSDDELADMTTENVIDYWLADIEGLPAGAQSPAIDPPALVAGSAWTYWSRRQQLANSLLPRGKVAVRIVLNSKMAIPAANKSLTLTDTTYLSQFRRVDVDVDRLSVPRGFSRAPVPDLDEDNP